MIIFTVERHVSYEYGKVLKVFNTELKAKKWAENLYKNRDKEGMCLLTRDELDIRAYKVE